MHAAGKLPHLMAIEGKELAIACARAAEEMQAEDVCPIVESMADIGL